MNASERLTKEQIIKAIDKGLKGYENLIGMDVLEKNKKYVKLCEVLTAYDFNEAEFKAVQEAFNNFTNSL